MNGLDPRDLIPGRRYRVEVQDCCVRAWFEAVFVRPQGDPDLPVLVFDAAELDTSTRGGWGVYACPESG
jgi:hypothetical protein